MEWKIIIPSVVIILGWFIVHWNASNRDFNSKKREVRIEYLIEAYRSIASAANREERTTDTQKLKIESAIEDTQLLGNGRQLEALNDLIESGDCDFTKILEVLRAELRKELKLESVSNPLKFYRMSRG